MLICKAFFEAKKMSLFFWSVEKEDGMLNRDNYSIWYRLIKPILYLKSRDVKEFSHATGADLTLTEYEYLN